MPTYEYVCKTCEHRFEQFQSMLDKPVKKCPECGKGKVERVIHGGVGVLFKGSGFYKTDYRPKGYSESAKKDKPAAPACPGDCSSCPSAKK